MIEIILEACISESLANIIRIFHVAKLRIKIDYAIKFGKRVLTWLKFGKRVLTWLNIMSFFTLDIIHIRNKHM